MVSTEGPAIIRLLIDGIETTEVCKLLRVCDGNEDKDLGDSLTSFRENISIENLNPVVVKKKEDSTCATCTYVVSQVLEQVSLLNNCNQSHLLNDFEARRSTLLHNSFSHN